MHDGEAQRTILLCKIDEITNAAAAIDDPKVIFSKIAELFFSAQAIVSEPQTPAPTEMIDAAEANIRADYRAGTISKEQFRKEMLIVARARQQAPAPQKREAE